MAKTNITDFLPVAGSIFDTVFGALFGSHQQDRQFEMQKELMDKAQQQGFENMDYQQRLSKDTFNYTFGREASLNESLMHNSPSIQKQAMIDAGINPASNFGSFSGNLAQSSAPTYTPQGSAPSAPSAPPVSSSLGQSLRSLAEIPMMREQTELLKEEARKKKLDNDATVEENTWYRWAFDPEFENLTYNPEVKGYVLPDVEHIVPKALTRKGIEAKQLAKKEIEGKLASLDNQISQDNLREMVANKQIKDNEVIQALVKLPVEEYNEVVQRIAEMASKISLNDSHGKLFVSQSELYNLEKEFSPKAILEKLVNKPFDFATWFTTLISIALKRAMGR